MVRAQSKVITTAAVDEAALSAEACLRWREKEFQKHVLALAEECGWTFRYHSYFSDRSERGFPDVMLLRPERGEIVFAELKTMNGRLGPVQQEWLDALRACAGDKLRVFVWRPCCWNSGEIAAALR
jgi:hypothetical protein